MSKRPWTTLRFCHLTFTMALLAIVLAANGLADEWQAPQRAVRKKNPLACDAQQLAVGRDLYMQNCAPCHGETGRGDGVASPNLEPKPKDFTATPVVKQTDGALFWKIGEGHRPMPGFDQTISEDGRWHIVCYIRTFAPATTQPTRP
jgi:mono/diheme cytochrome c family protein